ncbi:MAG: DUF4843 domain-containing protein, partial [Polaribacter sp.]
MKKYKIIVITCLIALGFLACEKEGIATFSGENLIYFKWAKDGKPELNDLQIDSIAVTFAYSLPSKVSDTLFKIPIKIQGLTSSQDRVVEVKVMDASTAQLGVHYTIPDKIIIPADSVVGNIPITFMRTA